jgi:predicted amidophosphoribosyltransferase
MALINCPDCGKPVSSQAKNCRHCGRPSPNAFPMKALAAIALGLILVFNMPTFAGLFGTVFQPWLNGTIHNLQEAAKSKTADVVNRVGK